MSVPTGSGNYPPGVTDNDPHFDCWDEPDDEFTPGVDGCHHGYGFDEQCDECDYEIWEDQRREAEARRLAEDIQMQLKLL